MSSGLARTTDTISRDPPTRLQGVPTDALSAGRFQAAGVANPKSPDTNTPMHRPQSDNLRPMYTGMYRAVDARTRNSSASGSKA